MPFVKSGGKWVSSADGSAGDIVPQRLVIIDKQVDDNGCFRKSLKASTQVVQFDSKMHTAAELCEMIRSAHRTSGTPFISIAFANHGPETSGTDAWIMAKDLEVDATPAGTEEAITKMVPLMEVMLASLAKKSSAHIAFLACSLASTPFLPDLVPAMEALYGVDFMASTNTTGNAAEGGDWVLETDSFSFSKTYCDPKQLKKFRGSMGVGWNTMGDNDFSGGYGGDFGGGSSHGGGW